MNKIFWEKFKKQFMIETRYYLRKTDLRSFHFRWASIAFGILILGFFIGKIIFRMSPPPIRYIGFLIILSSLPASIPGIAQIIIKEGPDKFSGRRKGIFPVIEGWIIVIICSIGVLIGLYLLVFGKGF